jgi:hypothetical protein
MVNQSANGPEEVEEVHFVSLPFQPQLLRLLGDDFFLFFTCHTRRLVNGGLDVVAR